jgi:hypothetical protein
MDTSCCSKYLLSFQGHYEAPMPSSRVLTLPRMFLLDLIYEVSELPFILQDPDETVYHL